MYRLPVSASRICCDFDKKLLIFDNMLKKNVKSGKLKNGDQTAPTRMRFPAKPPVSQGVGCGLD
jgi:hypothetical protein